MFDFDQINEWGPELSEALRGIVPTRASALIHGVEFIEDARDRLYAICSGGARAIIETTRAWLSERHIAAYHGSRLTADEVAKVRAQGILMLRPGDRRSRLKMVLSSHPAWNVSTFLRVFGNCADGMDGNREGQAHLTLSKAGLVQGFNHYLKYGSEFDQRIAVRLYGPQGLELLAARGAPVLFRCAVPGDEALAAANPWDFPEPGSGPDLVRQTIEAWAYWIANPGFQSASLRLDCGLVFFRDLDPAWIVGIERPPL